MPKGVRGAPSLVRKVSWGWKTPPVRLLEYLVEMFVQGFGITRPSEAQRRRVTLLLGGALLSAALLVVVIAIGMVVYLNHPR